MEDLMSHDAIWQRAGVSFRSPQSVEDAVRLSGLDYVVDRKPVKTVLGRSHINLQGFHALVRRDTGRCLSICKDRYTIVSNEEAMSVLTPLANKALFIEAGGTIDGGKKAFLLARLPQDMRIGPARDAIRRYLIVVNSFDGSTGIVVKPTSVRVRCSNAIPGILRGSEPAIRLRHTRDVHNRLAEAQNMIRRAEGAFHELEFMFNRFALRRLTNKELMEYVRRLVPENELAESHTRTENLRKHILEAHESGIGAEAYRGTLMGLLNSVSEVTDHAPTKDTNKMLKSVFFGGQSEKLKLRAFQLAESML